MSRKTSVNLQQQSVPVEGESYARRSANSKELISVYYDDVTTVYEAFLRGKRISGDSPCLGNMDPSIKAYAWQGYNEIHRRSTNFGSGLVCKGCVPSQETFIGIYAQNCTEWVLTDLGCQMYSMITVPIYDTHGPEACVHIINHADIKAVICQAIKVPFLLQNLKKCPKLKIIIKIGHDVTEDEQRDAKDLGIEIISFADIEKLGENNFTDRNPQKPDDIFTICYTSGTTGTPKGAMITNKGIIASFSAVLYSYEVCGILSTTEDAYLSYLPLAHIYERTAYLLVLSGGARIGFYRGDPKLLLEDIQALKPTIFAAVPRILNRVYDKIVEGYGQTECSTACCLQSPQDLTAGHVGPPMACNWIKLFDVPEKNYYAKDGKGEIAIKGPNVFKGYLKDPEKTAETIDKDGWLHTGDVGELLENGTFKIIDRSKHIFKLSQGEYVAPEKIELVCVRSLYVEQIFIHGEGLKSYVVAIVVPDDEALQQLAKKENIAGNRAALCRNEVINGIIFNDIIQKCKEGQLASFEKPKGIYLQDEPLSVDNGLLTPTFKAKRPSILKHFRQQIDDLYQKVDIDQKFHRSASEMSIKLEIDSSKLNGNQ
ncbi:Long-chain-fatty-acid--CoA ligase 1 [Exaiptasia diaphana]|nr:Long-chain-fatty-acid--CoA ligase 1 [Exaiptasia diaphana]